VKEGKGMLKDTQKETPNQAVQNALENYINPFTPSMASIKALQEVTIGREEILDSVRNALRKNAPWVMLCGPRGFGKTHLITLLLDEVRQDKKLCAQYRIAWLPEDATGYFNWNDWLEKIGDKLAKEYPNNPESKHLQIFQDKTLRKLSGASRTQAMEGAIRQFLGNNTLLLVQENIEKLLSALDKEADRAELMAFLDTTSVYFLAGTAAVGHQEAFTEKRRIATSSYREKYRPKDFLASDFAQRFEKHLLTEFTVDEALSYLKKRAKQSDNKNLIAFLETDKARVRVQTINLLAGGAPRIWAIFAEFMHESDDAEKTLLEWNQLSAQLTTYYQERGWNLEGRQGQIVRILAENSGALPVSEIAERADEKQTAISGQLAELIEKGYVQKEKVRGWYDLREPLYRLYFQTKDAQGTPVQLLVDFLIRWFSKQELQFKYDHTPQSAYQTRAYYSEGIRLLDLSPEDFIDRAVNEKIASIDDCIRGKNYIEAVNLCSEILAESPDLAFIWGQKGFCQRQLGHREEAIACYKEALTLQPSHTYSLYYLTLALLEEGKWDEAIQHLRETFRWAFKFKQRDDALVSICEGWVKHGKTDEALEHASQITNIESQNRVLIAICGGLAKAGNVEDALAEVYKISDLNTRATALIRIAKEIMPSDSAQAILLLNQVLEITRKLDSEDDNTLMNRTLALVRVAAQMAITEPQKSLTLFDESLVLIQKVDTPLSYWGTIKAISSAIAPIHFKKYYTFLSEAIDQFKEESKSKNKKRLSFDPQQLIGRIATEMAEAGRTEEALRIAAKISESYYYTNTMGNIAAEVAKTDNKKAQLIFDEALKITQSIKNTNFTNYTTGNLIGKIAKSGEVEKAMRLAKEYFPNTAKDTLHIHSNILFTIALDMLKVDKAKATLMLEETLELVRQDDDVLLRNETLVHIAIVIIIDDRKRGEALFDEVFASVQEITIVSDGTTKFIQNSQKLGTIALQFAVIERFDEAISLAVRINEFTVRANVLSNLVRVLAMKGHFDKADALRERIEGGERFYTDNTIALCRAILSCHEESLEWETPLRSLITLYQENNALGDLGQGITQTIPDLFDATDEIDDTLCAQWRDAWLAVGAGHDDLTIPLRLLTAATEWRVSVDESVLLRLPLEEREILAQLLPTDWRR
jgi:tetratricopeptide (TPR) repeat protein